MLSGERRSKGWSLATVLVGTATGVVVTVGLALLGWSWTDQPVSDFPSWLEAWATVLGVAAAIVAGVYAARAYELESEREDKWEQQQRASQAALIGAWADGLTQATKPPTEQTDLFETSDPLTVTGARALLRNASPLPAMEVTVEFWLVLLDHQSVGRDRRLLGTERLAYLPPSAETVPVTLHLGDEPHRRTTAEAQHSELRVELHFRDAAGQVWSRDAIGQLVAAR